MRGLRDWFNRHGSLFNPLEAGLIVAVQSALSAEAGELWARQIERINLIRRHTLSREILCYCIRDGKPNHDSALHFPADIKELKFATVRFSAPGFSETWNAEFSLIRGYFFSIVFSPSPEKIQTISDVRILTIEIHHDPAVKILDVKPELIEAKNPDFSGWLQSWQQNHDVKSAYEPLSQQEREQLSSRFPVPLPSDYLQIIKQCEGFEVEDVSVLGLSQVYEIVLPDGNYYVLAIISDRGVIATRADSGDTSLYFLDYDGGASMTGNSFRQAVEKFIGSQ